MIEKTLLIDDTHQLANFIKHYMAKLGTDALICTAGQHGIEISGSHEGAHSSTHELTDDLTTATGQTLIEVGQLHIDRQAHQVFFNAHPIQLTAIEFKLLSFLSQSPDQVFSRLELLAAVWGYQHSGYEQTVNSHVNRLRSKLEQVAPQMIETVWGVGYKLNAQACHAF